MGERQRARAPAISLRSRKTQLPERSGRARELRTAIDLQPFQEVAAEKHQECPRLLRRQGADAQLSGAFHFKCIDEAVLKVDPDTILVARDAPGAYAAAQPKENLA